MDWFVCVFLSQARALSLSVFRFSHTVSVSPRFLPSCSDLHLNLITFTRKYYLYYVFLLPLICNISCILRDATGCVCVCFAVVRTVQKREVCPIFLPVCVWFCFFCFCEGVWFFLLAIAQLVFVGCWGLLNFFFIINFLFFFLSAVCGCDSRDVSISNGRGISFYQQQCCSWWQSQFLRRMI